LLKYGFFAIIWVFKQNKMSLESQKQKSQQNSSLEKGSKVSIVDTLKSLQMDASRKGREKLFDSLKAELGLPIDAKYDFSAQQNILLNNFLLEKVKNGLVLNQAIGENPAKVATKKTPQKETKSAEKIQSIQPEAQRGIYAQLAIQAERAYLGNPYDTDPNGRDGLASIKGKQRGGNFELRNNLTGEIFSSKKEPLTCIDLTMRGFRAAGVTCFEKYKSGDAFSLRRVGNLEKIIQANPSQLVMIPVNQDFSRGREITWKDKLRCQVGDAITTTIRNGSRHIGRVTEVDATGFPLKIIHSSGAMGVVETPFMNGKSLGKDPRGKERFADFMGREKTRINYVVRPTQQAITLAAAKQKGSAA
jgi:hypothetical protein